MDIRGGGFGHFFVALVGILPVSVGGIIKSLISLSLKQKRLFQAMLVFVGENAGKYCQSAVIVYRGNRGRRNREHVCLFFRQKDISTKQVDDSSLAF